VDPQDNIHLAGIADPVAAGTHFVAFLAMLGGSRALLARTVARPYARTLAFIYALATLAQYAASTVYHTWHGMLLRRVDHASIYILIAGTFTPIAGLQLSTVPRSLILVASWSFAVAGVVLKLFFFDSVSEGVDTALYLGAGWFGAVPTLFIWRRGERRTTAWIVFGAVVYSIGALCELFGWPRLVPGVFNFHEVFHLCVMLAGASMFVAVWRSTDERLAPRQRVVITRRGP